MLARDLLFKKRNNIRQNSLDVSWLVQDLLSNELPLYKYQ